MTAEESLRGRIDSLTEEAELAAAEWARVCESEREIAAGATLDAEELFKELGV